jgi:diacylglycerol kinase (ATP)
MGNGRFYGGPFALFPSASLKDGRLHVRIFPKANVRLALACLFGICTGRVGHVGGSLDLTATRLRLWAASRVPFQVDGEFVGELPAELELEPRRLRILGP